MVFKVTAHTSGFSRTEVKRQRRSAVAYPKLSPSIRSDPPHDGLGLEKEHWEVQ